MKYYIILLILLQFVSDFKVKCSDDLLVISIATEATDGYKRFEQSLKAYNYKYEIFGFGHEWRGGDIKTSAGGGQKLNILKAELEKYRNDAEKIFIFTDSYDVIANEAPETVLEKFKKSNARLIFSAEETCWPDMSLANDYPEVSPTEKRFLNSGGMMGYITDLIEIINLATIKDDDDDQLYYTKIYLNQNLREKYKIQLDTRSNIFQNLNGALDEIILMNVESNIVIYNNITKSQPSFLHGNGPTKLILNRIGNYMGKAYSIDGCKVCNGDKIILDPEQSSQWPNVTVGIFIETGTPFLYEFLKKVSNLNYPKSKLTLLIHNNVEQHSQLVKDFFVNPDNEGYNSIKYISPDEFITEIDAKTESLEECIKTNCDFYFMLESTAHLDNANTLKILIEQNRPVLAPIMLRKGSTWSNVWGDVDMNGYYKRSFDYLDIINRNKLGVWNLPYVSEAVLMKKEILKKVVYEDTLLEPSLKFAQHLRNNDVFMFGTNMEYFGHLINTETFNVSLIRPEMYEIFTNYDDWVARYVNPEYFKFLANSSLALEPCNDVFWFPVVTDEFCEDLIVMMEHFGQWSGGRHHNKDERLPGGYENVPTVDIHMKQVNWDKHWLFFLKKIIMPMQQNIFYGYYSDPPAALLSFVVRYRTGEQEYLKPHNDASTYTLNIALNRPHIDFEGGGCKFVRRNCSVTETKKGWAMIHPGRLTHLHEGLKVTKGTRYIMVTFIDP